MENISDTLHFFIIYNVLDIIISLFGTRNWSKPVIGFGLDFSSCSIDLVQFMVAVNCNVVLLSTTYLDSPFDVCWLYSTPYGKLSFIVYNLNLWSVQLRCHSKKLGEFNGGSWWIFFRFYFIAHNHHCSSLPLFSINKHLHLFDRCKSWTTLF